MQKISFVPLGECENLKKIFNDYLVEIAKFDDGVKFNKKGEPEYKWFDFYWKDKGRYPIYYLVDGKIAGFALIRELEKMKYEIAEFCVLNEYRGKGYASKFAEMVCDFFSGQMKFSTNLKNERAVKFWSGFVKKFNYSQFDEAGRRNWLLAR